MATILLVEDERDLAVLVRASLEAEGHTVYYAPMAWPRPFERGMRTCT